MDRVKNHIMTIITLLAAAAFIASCASKPASPAPEPEPEPEPAPAAVEPATAPAIAQADLDALLAKAKELKKRAFDLQLYEVLPDEYKAADARLAAGKEAYDGKNDVAAKENLEASVAAFSSLIERGLVELVSIRKQDAEDAKSLALKADAESRAPDRLETGDESFVEAERQAGDGKPEEAIAAYEDARLCYELAFKRSDAASLKDEIEERDFAKWDAGNYQLAEGKFEAEESLWASGSAEDRAAGVDALEEAILRFNLVIQKGKETLAVNSKESAASSKERSEEIRADVAARDEYEAALAAFDEAERLLKTNEYEAATDGFDEASDAFEQAYDIAAEKRERAEEAMREADEAAAESERKAEEADPIVNGAES